MITTTYHPSMQPFNGTAGLLTRFEENVRALPEKTAATFLGEDETQKSITYAELQRRARLLAAHLNWHAELGERALLLFPSGLEFIVAFIACLYAGVIAVPSPLPRRRGASRLAHLVKDATPRVVLTTSQSSGSVRDALQGGIDPERILLIDQPEYEEEIFWCPPRISADTTAFLQYTSGSTNAPRGVIVTHRNLASNTDHIRVALQLSRDSRLVSWLPLFHDMGLIGNTLAQLFTGTSFLFMAPAVFLQRPARFLQAVSEHRATLFGQPNFAWDHCVRSIAPEQRALIDLRSVQLVYSGSEQVRAGSLERFYEAFAPCGLSRDAIFTAYGLAEATLMVSAGPARAHPPVLSLDAAAIEGHQVKDAPAGCPEARRLVACGKLWGDTQVRIVDPERRIACPPGVVGEIWVSGASVAAGYWNQPELTASTFHARLAEPDEGPFLRTGDLGFIRDGQLFIAGRLKDLIIIRGRNLYPQDIEQTMEGVAPFIQPNGCAAVALDSNDGETLAAVIEADRTFARKISPLDTAARNEPERKTTASKDTEVAAVVSRLRQAVTEEFDVPLHRVVFVAPGSFPRTTSGKVQRSLCRKQLLSGDLKVLFDSQPAEPRASFPHTNGTVRTLPIADSDPGVSPVQVTEMKQFIHDIIVRWMRRELKQAVDALNDDASFSSFGIDSLGLTQLALELEPLTEVHLTPEILADHPCIAKLACYLVAHGAVVDNLKRTEIRSQSAQFAPDGGQEINALPVTPVSTDRDHLIQRYVQADGRPARMRAANRYFYHLPISGQAGARLESEGRSLLNMVSYSYLGLTDHPELVLAASRALLQFGTGSHGTRILAGTTTIHRELEQKLAPFLGAEDAIVFNGGYLTNLSTISSLVGSGDCVITDEWNHASIADGCRFSGATVLPLKHNDMAALEDCLKRADGRHTLVVVDSVYSMEGDIADLPRMIPLCRKYGAMLMVDEAHSIGVLGRTGRGIQEHFALPSDAIDIKMGTLSKAFPTCGGYVAARREIIDYLRHNARGYVFSCAPTPADVAAASAAIDVLCREPERVERVRQLRERYAVGLRALGFDLMGSQTQVVPIATRTEHTTLEFTYLCKQEGLYVLPIFYPAVPMNAPRVRTCIMASHSDSDIDFALNVLAKAGLATGLIGKQ